MSEIEGEETVTMTVGEQLRAAREAANLSLEDVATTTRIPTRHLSSLETGDFERLPAPTYSVGFARSYAAAVGLDRDAIGTQLRGELGGTRPVTHPTEQFEPIDSSRAMPRWLIPVAIAAIIAVVLIATWLNSRSLSAPDDGVVETAQPAAPAVAAATPPAAAAGPVTIAATDAAWVQIRDGDNMLKEGVMQAGERFTVPPTATAPTLTTAKAEALTISVGTTAAPPIGPPATRVTRVSLKPDDLLRPRPAAAAPTAVPTTAPTATASPRPAARPAPRPEPRPRAAPPPAAPTPAATNTVTPAQPAGQ